MSKNTVSLHSSTKMVTVLTEEVKDEKQELCKTDVLP